MKEDFFVSSLIYQNDGVTDQNGTEIIGYKA